jgi:hypothetical protein
VIDVQLIHQGSAQLPSRTVNEGRQYQVNTPTLTTKYLDDLGNALVVSRSYWERNGIADKSYVAARNGTVAVSICIARFARVERVLPVSRHIFKHRGRREPPIDHRNPNAGHNAIGLKIAFKPANMR